MRHERTVVLLGWAAAAALLLSSAGRTWGLGPTDGLGARPEVTGPPSVRAVGVAALAAAAVLPLLRGRGRRLLGVLGLVLGGFGVAAAVAGRPAQPGAWPQLAVGAGALLTACGALVLLRAPRWPQAGARFEPPGAGSSATPGGEAARSRDAWDALDRGEDPTR
jgi:Tryptophan-associated transmembrane protein (Trp_oprn_chp)